MFGTIMYFVWTTILPIQEMARELIVKQMNNYDRDPSKFFIYLLFVYATTICVTALYRMLAALSPTINDAVRFAGIALNLLIIYTGYAIPLPQLLHQKLWFGWVSLFLFCCKTRPKRSKEYLRSSFCRLHTTISATRLACSRTVI